MRKALLSFVLISSVMFAQDPIIVSPDTLDYGNILMGNTPTMTFTLTCNLDQTITISPPSFYSVDISEITMTSGETQDIVVTFDPPQIGNYDSQIVLAGSTFGNAVVVVTANATNNLSGSMSGILTSEFSPYQITDDLIVEAGNEWGIGPGTELQFAFGKKLTVNGILNAIGNFDDKITMTAMTPDSGWAGVFIENSEQSNLTYVDVKHVTNNLSDGRDYILYEDYEDGDDGITNNSAGTIITDSSANGNKVLNVNIPGDNNGRIPFLIIPSDIHQGSQMRVDINFRSTTNYHEDGYPTHIRHGYINDDNTIVWESHILYLYDDNFDFEYGTISLIAGGVENYSDKRLVLYCYRSSSAPEEEIFIDEIGVYRYDSYGDTGGNINFENRLSRFPSVVIDNTDSEMDGSYMVFKALGYEYTYYNTPFFTVLGSEIELNFDIKVVNNMGGNGYLKLYMKNSSDLGQSYNIWERVEGENIIKTNISLNLDNYDGSEKVMFFLQAYSNNSDRQNFYAYIDNFKIIGSKGSSAVNFINSENLLINNSSITSSLGGLNIENTNCIVKNCVIYDNEYAGITALNTTGAILNSILWGNQVGIMGFDSYGLSMNYSIYSSALGEIYIGNNNVQSYPMFDLETFELNLLSPAIDNGHPDDYDGCQPPGQGSLSADIGIFGGMNNCGAEGTNIGGGEPTINTIEDLPQDQGGFVGLQFGASFYDGGSDIYDISHYSIWRELNTGGRNNIDFSDVPIGQFYRPNNRDDEAWEYIGESPAQEFDVYGFTAPTLADSNYIGQFWSKFLVVAHTSDEDVFFVSVPDSGYSVDNLAPDNPENVRVGTFVYENTLEWGMPMEGDFWQTEIRKNDEVLALGSDFTQFIETNISPGQLSRYEITHIDENGNRSESSSRDIQSPEWVIRLETQSESVSNSNFYFAGNDSATIGYDAMYDLFAPPAPPGDNIRLMVSHPEWNTGGNDEFSYISVGNADLDYFYREVVIEVYSTVNDTVSVQIYPEGNYTGAQLGISINNGMMNFIDFTGTFDIPVNDSLETTIRILLGNPNGDDGNISFVKPDFISVIQESVQNVIFAKSPRVQTIDLSYTMDGNNFVAMETIQGNSQVMDTTNIDWVSYLTNANQDHLQNVQYKAMAYDSYGVLIGEVISEQFTVIGNEYILSLPTADWRMIHPYYRGENVNDLLASSLAGFTAYWWNQESHAYEIVNNTDYVSQKAQSIWVRNMNQNDSLQLSGLYPESEHEVFQAEIGNFPGWVMLGSSARPVSKDSIIVRLLHGSDSPVEYSWEEAVANGIVQDGVFSYLSGNSEYELIEQFNMSAGFWVGITEEDTSLVDSIIFEFPPHYLEMASNRNMQDLSFDWGVTLNNLSIGFRELASNGQDGFDIVAPPYAPGNAVQMRINHAEWGSPLGAFYMSDIRHGFDGGDISAFELVFSQSGEFDLGIERFNIPDSFGVVMQIGNEQFDLMEVENLTLTIENDLNAIVYIGRTDLLSNASEDLMPLQYSLHQNYPNPFNPVTTISYDLPEVAQVVISIYDIMGREVKTLVNLEQIAGFKSVVWDATNNMGQPVSAGMYLYRISALQQNGGQAGDFYQVKKMVLLK